jgi:hypothetical protein
MDKIVLQNPSLSSECDFCKARGILGKNIFAKEGWHYCKHCLVEVGNMRKRLLERRKYPGLL